MNESRMRTLYVQPIKSKVGYCKAVAEIWFMRLHKSQRNQEAMLEANVTNAAELNEVASQRYVWKCSMAKRTKISKFEYLNSDCCEDRYGLNPLSSPLVLFPSTKVCWCTLDSIGGEKWNNRGHHSAAPIAKHNGKDPKSSIFRDSEEIECQSEKFDNMQAVFFYKKKPSERGDKEVRAAGRSIIAEHNQLVMIIHSILQIIGNCQLPYEEQLEGILMAALLTVYQKPHCKQRTWIMRERAC